LSRGQSARKERRETLFLHRFKVALKWRISLKIFKKFLKSQQQRLRLIFFPFCRNKKLSGYQIGLGVHKRSTFWPFLNISSIHRHRNYLGLKNDIAIFKLAEPVRFSPKSTPPGRSEVQPVKLPDENFQLCPGSEVIVTGWGSVIPQNLTWHLRKQHSHAACSFVFGIILAKKLAFCFSSSQLL
jgi:hypothetical protein